MDIFVPWSLSHKLVDTEEYSRELLNACAFLIVS